MSNMIPPATAVKPPIINPASVSFDGIEQLVLLNLENNYYLIYQELAIKNMHKSYYDLNFEI